MIAVLDACVLYPPSLRDILMWLSVVNAYQPRWTEEIHAEWMRNVLADRPDVAPAQLERTRRMMDETNPQALTTGYERHIPALRLPDPDDLHVLAAAIESGATLIVTFNIKDFPQHALAPHGVRALAPDAFLEAIFVANRPRFLRGARQHRASLKAPSKTAEEYLSALRAQGLPKTALRLEACKKEI